MAHLRSIKRQCNHRGCVSAAVSELLSSRNASMGVYCGKHSKRALADRMRAEAEDAERAAAEFAARTEELRGMFGR